MFSLISTILKGFIIKNIKAYDIAMDSIESIILDIDYIDVKDLTDFNILYEKVFSNALDELYEKIGIIDMLKIQPYYLAKRFLVDLNSLNIGTFTIETNWPEAFQGKEIIDSDHIDKRYPEAYYAYHGDKKYQRFVIGVNCKKPEKN